MATRESKVQELVEAMMAGATEELLQSASGDEVFSAGLTIALRMIKACVLAGGDTNQIRASVYRLLLEVPEGSKPS